MLKKYPPVLKEAGNIFYQAGFQAYLVGGAVRDMLMGLPLTDYDLATDAQPEEVIQLFRRVIPTGIKHGTVTVHYKKITFEVTTFRVDGQYSNQRHPDSISFSPSLAEDLKRRDLTINAIALDLVTGEIVDPQGGREDIKNKLIRAIGNPVERFTEDGLRLLRTVRFASQLDFLIEPETRGALRICRNNLRQVSFERIREELNKILGSEKPSRAFAIMEDTGILPIFMPELSQCRGVEQKGYHLFDVFEHSLYACDGAPRDNLPVRLAALLHDIGKPAALRPGELGIPTFYNHELISEKLARGILLRLKYPKAVENRVCHLIRHHMFHYEDAWTDGAVRRFLAKAGPENIPDLFALRRADQYGMALKKTAGALESFQKRIEKVLREDQALTPKDLAINGNDLQEELKIPRGPQVGTVINFLLETVLDDPSQNNRETLLELAEKFYNTRLKVKS